MLVSESTHNRVRELARAVVTSRNRDFSTSQSAYVVLRTSNPSKSVEDDSRDGFFLFGEPARLYQIALKELQDDLAVEHLTRANLDSALGDLVCDLEDQREQMKDRTNLRVRIDSFLSEISRPLQRYEVAFSVENVEFDDEPLTIDKVVFRNFTPNIAEEWGFNAEKGPIRSMFDKVIGQAVGIVTVDAGTPEKAAERARECFDRSLNTLRVCIASSNLFRGWDEDLLQRRGQYRVIREVGTQPRLVSTGGGRVFRPINLKLAGELEDSTEEFIKKLLPVYDGKIPEKLRDALLRSLEWIGTSITREQYDHKVVDLCSALEAILTTKDDPRKGEAVALRGMLLSAALETSFCLPRVILHLYVNRSEVIHGSVLGVCGENDYLTLRRSAVETVLNVIKFEELEGPFVRPIDFIRHLESRERLEKAINWLEPWRDNDTKSITAYAKERLAKLGQGDND